MKKHLLSLITSFFVLTSSALAVDIQPTQDQAWWGYYTTDYGRSGLGLSSSTTYDVAMLVKGDNPIVANKTLKAVRIYLRDKSNMSNLRIWFSRNLPDDISKADYVQEVNLSSLKGGDEDNNRGLANEITLKSNYVTTGEDVYFGYSFTIKNSGSSADNYPVVTASMDSKPETLILRTTNSSLAEWTEFGDTYGALTMQLLVEGQFAQNAILAEDFGTVITTKDDLIKVPIANIGINDVTSLSYKVSVDGVDSPDGETDYNISAVKFQETALVSVPLSSASESKAQSVKITITKVNGMPNECSTKESNGKLVTLKESAVPVPVVEEFTATWCGYCPYGFVGMEHAREKYGDKVVLIAVHGSDVMECDGYLPVLDAYVDGYPSSVINRKGYVYPYYLNYYLDPYLSAVVAGSISAKAVWSDDDQTAINITTSTTFQYSDDSANYGIAFVLLADGLSGTGSSWAQSNFLSGESGEDDMAYWYSASSKIAGFVYDHVAVDAWDILNGVDGSVSPVIQQGVPQQFRFVADISRNTIIQDKSKLSVVALLINREDGTIVNADEVKIGAPEPDAVDALHPTSVTEVTRYNASGQSLSSSQRGLNIIRMSDGSVRKVLVK